MLETMSGGSAPRGARLAWARMLSSGTMSGCEVAGVASGGTPLAAGAGTPWPLWSARSNDSRRAFSFCKSEACDGLAAGDPLEVVSTAGLPRALKSSSIRVSNWSCPFVMSCSASVAPIKRAVVASQGTAMGVGETKACGVPGAAGLRVGVFSSDTRASRTQDDEGERDCEQSSFANCDPVAVSYLRERSDEEDKVLVAVPISLPGDEPPFVNTEHEHPHRVHNPRRDKEHVGDAEHAQGEEQAPTRPERRPE